MQHHLAELRRLGRVPVLDPTLESTRALHQHTNGTRICFRW